MTKDMGNVYYSMIELINSKHDEFHNKAGLARALAKVGRSVSRQRIQQLILRAIARGDLKEDHLSTIASYNPNMIRHGKSRHPQWHGQSKEQLSETLSGDAGRTE